MSNFEKNNNYNIGVATTDMHSEFGMEFGYDEYYSLTY